MNSFGPDKYWLTARLCNKGFFEAAAFFGWRIRENWVHTFVLHNLPELLALLFICGLHCHPDKEVRPPCLIASSDVEVREVRTFKNRMVCPARLVLGQLSANLRFGKATPTNRVDLVLEISGVRIIRFCEAQQEWQNRIIARLSWIKRIKINVAVCPQDVSITSSSHGIIHNGRHVLLQRLAETIGQLQIWQIYSPGPDHDSTIVATVHPSVKV